MPTAIAIGDTVELVEKINSILDNVLAINTIAAGVVDWSYDYNVKAMSSPQTFTFSNVPATGTTATTFLELVVTGGATPTWPAAVVWEEGITPTFTSGKTHLIMFITRDGGTTVRGIARLNFAS